MAEIDNAYWAADHPHPLAPNETDVETYRELIGSAHTRLLLGNTRALMPLCTAAMDTDPFIDDPRVISQDWTTNMVDYDVIFGDGVLNFTADLAEQLLPMAARHSHRFIVRAFSHRLPIMRVADNFPLANDFAIAPSHVLERVDYRFFVWDFTDSRANDNSSDPEGAS
jgi:hypothetical protein